ncbi:unnamed protein product [Ectocarpus sp. 13 AM-2016]
MYVAQIVRACLMLVSLSFFPRPSFSSLLLLYAHEGRFWSWFCFCSSALPAFVWWVCTIYSCYVFGYEVRVGNGAAASGVVSNEELVNASKKLTRRGLDAALLHHARPPCCGVWRVRYCVVSICKECEMHREEEASLRTPHR